MRHERRGEPWGAALGGVLDLLTLAVVAVAAGLAILFDLPAPIKVAGGLFLLLFAPGYALVSALFPERRRAQAQDTVAPVGLTGLERFALALGAGVALVPILGLAVNLTPSGLATPTVVVALLGTTLGLGALGAWRRLILPVSDRFDPLTRPLLASRHAAALPVGPALAVVGVIVVAGLGAALHLATIDKPPARFTSVWLHDEYGRSAAYVTSMEAGSAAGFEVGVRNEEGRDVVYGVEFVLERGSWSREGPGALFVPLDVVEERTFDIRVPHGTVSTFDVNVSAAEAGLHRFTLTLAAIGVETRVVSFWFEARFPLSSEVVVGLAATNATAKIGDRVPLSVTARPAVSASVAVDLILYAERGNATGDTFTALEVQVLDRWRFDLTPGEIWSETAYFAPRAVGTYRLTAALEGTTNVTHPNGRATLWLEVTS